MRVRLRRMRRRKSAVGDGEGKWLMEEVVDVRDGDRDGGGGG